MNRITVPILFLSLVAATATDAAAQIWGRPAVPRVGACFYEDINFGGRYFCTTIGGSSGHLRGGADDDMSSIQIFGNAEVIVYKDSNFKGSSRVFTRSVRDLRTSGFNDRVTSYQIGYRGQYGGANWGNGRAGGAYGGGSYGGSYGDDGWSGSGGFRAPSNRVSYGEAVAMVRRGYREVLGREPEPSGLASWTKGVIDNNWDQAELNRQLRNTPEGRQRRR